MLVGPQPVVQGDRTAAAVTLQTLTTATATACCCGRRGVLCPSSLSQVQHHTPKSLLTTRSLQLCFSLVLEQISSHRCLLRKHCIAGSLVFCFSLLTPALALPVLPRMETSYMGTCSSRKHFWKFPRDKRCTCSLFNARTTGNLNEKLKLQEV